MAKIPFMKLSGAGNDFVIIDNLKRIVPYENTDFVAKVCERRMSVGADGILLVENSEQADFKMRYFNADGGEAETCGNGARCISKFAHINGITSERMRFETKAGVYESEILKSGVKVRMSDPVDVRLNFPLRLEDGVYTVCSVNSGVPHVVFFIEDLEAADVVNLGAQTRYHGDFQPAGTNVNFVRIKNEREIDVRTYERGVEDETLACGTGSIASAVISALLGKTVAPVAVRTASGSVLTIHFELDDGGAKNVHLEGDARVIYAGELEEGAWNY